MMSVKKTKTPDHYPCGHMRGPGWHDLARLPHQAGNRGG